MSKKNTIGDLRDHLFETLEALRDEEQPMDLDRARAVADVAKVLVESAKVEVSMLKVTGGLNSTGFIPDELPPERRIGSGTPALPAARPLSSVAK